MGLKKAVKKGIVDFISPDDSAIDITKSNIEAYMETWERKHIVLKKDEQPTVFKINLSPNYKNITKIKNSSLGQVEDGIGLKMGTMVNITAKCILKDIINPTDMDEKDKIVFNCDRHGVPTDATLAELSELGVLDDIHNFYLTHKSDGANEEVKKN